MVNFRIDEDLKREMEQTCKNMGLTMVSAFTMFATKVTREQRIPFEITVDPFYSEENLGRLKKAIDDLNAGKGQRHDFIDEPDFYDDIRG